MKRQTFLLVLAGALFSGAVLAQAALTDGEIRKVDKDAKKITIKHGPMPSLDMPAMTMVFQVKDPALLDKVNAAITKLKTDGRLNDLSQRWIKMPLPAQL